MMRAVLCLGLGLLFWGCEPGADLPGGAPEPTDKIAQEGPEERPVAQTESTEADPKTRGEFTGPTIEPAPVAGDKANCQRMCGNDPICRVSCIVEDGAEAPGGGDPENCDQCGRETGFLPAPVIRAPSVENDGVWLEWSAVEGAEFYEVSAQQWGQSASGELTEQASYFWRTGDTRLLIPVESGYTYTFYVVARNVETKRQSVPSAPVAIVVD